MVPFVELRAHSAYSFGDGAVSPEDLVLRAAGLGCDAIALTDTADLGGIIRFALEARKCGVRPIAGAELRVDGRPAAFLARTGEGFRNLSALVTRARLENRRGRPGVSFDEVAERSAGLQALTGPAAGPIASLLLPENRGLRRPEEPPVAPMAPPGRAAPTSHAVPADRLTPTGRAAAARALARWKEVFGERLAVEVQLHHVSAAEEALAGALIELARGEGVPWVATNAPRYLGDRGRLLHDLFTALRAETTVDDAARRGLLLPNGEWRLKSPDEMAHLWEGREEGLEESARIAAGCDFDLRWLRPPLPRYPLPAAHDDDSFLRERVYAGATERWGAVDEAERAQIEHELDVIRRLGMAGFFVIMWDAVRFARSKGILCQGRGSAANSAVAYCLGITAVDPVKHGLLFERFLSEARADGLTEAPDIDVDFEMHRREEVLDYMYGRWGREHAAITCVTQAYHAPSAVQDVMRALGYPAELAFRISKRLHGLHPSEGAKTIEEELAPQLGLAALGLDLEAPRGRTLLRALRALDLLPRMRSTHPGGFVLSSAPLGEYMPIERTTMGRTILQFDKDDLDAAGVPKFDFLGLGGLSATRLAFDAIERRTGRRLELYELPQDDPETFAMIARGDTVGTFQIESRAQIQSLVQTRPEKLYDLVVQVALIRPGPIQGGFIRPYTRRRRGLEEWGYPHPALAPILRRTLGIPIFQEQAMAISMALGGFSAAEADGLRRSMGDAGKAERLKRALLGLRDRMVERGVEPATAMRIVVDLRGFANYGFPESHAWSFALIAYATAYLKAHYPAEFLLGLLNAWPMGFYSPATLVHDARRHGVEVRGPCMKQGEWDCTLETAAHAGARAWDRAKSTGTPEHVAPAGTPEHAPPAVRTGWRHIRGLGERTREALRTAHAEGPFTSIEDVTRRAGLGRAEALHIARAGAFEAFEPGRRRAAWEALRAAGDLLPLAPARHLPFDPEELEGEELILLDYLATGICTHGHPMEHLRARLRAQGILSSRDLKDVPGGIRITVAGLVIARQHPETAKGTVFVLLEDEGGFINVIVPRETYRRNREVVKFSRVLVIEGDAERDGRAFNLVGRRFRRLGMAGLELRSRDFR